MRAIRAIVNEAKKPGEIKESQYPFGVGKYEIKRGEGREKALTLEQIGRIASYSDGSDTVCYRDLWLFLYLCNGINVADFKTQDITRRINRKMKQIGEALGIPDILHIRLVIVSPRY